MATKKSSKKYPTKKSKPSPRRKAMRTQSIKKRIVVTCFAVVAIAICIALFFVLHRRPAVENARIIHETKFGGVYVTVPIDDFNELGFNYGDSVDVAFSNGYELDDLPYYNGYYVDIDEPLLIAYPGYDYIKVAINYGDDLWSVANLTTDDTASIKLNQPAKYLDNQIARDIHYSDIQGDTADEVFVNFRKVTVGNIKDGVLYRSASPVDNSHNRAPVVDRLIQNAGVKFIVNLSDSAEDLVEHINKSDFNSPYFLSLYHDDKVIPLDMTAQFKEQHFKEQLIKGLTAMSQHEGPYLVHCVEGKDRTGYVMMLIEALLGASYNEIIDDYMVTYDNYYNISLRTDPSRYQIIKDKNIDLMLHYIIGDETGNEDLTAITDYSNFARNYLLSIGMPEATIDQLIQNLSN